VENCQRSRIGSKVEGGRDLRVKKIAKHVRVLMTPNMRSIEIDMWMR